jgi:hypothetical protein
MHEFNVAAVQRLASGAGRRREIRMPVQLLGTLAAAGRAPGCVEIVDLSRGGACCRALAPPRAGSEVDLRLDGLTAVATVRWVAGRRFGLEFLRPLRASEILIQSGRSRNAHRQDHCYHALASRRIG